MLSRLKTLKRSTVSLTSFSPLFLSRSFTISHKTSFDLSSVTNLSVSDAVNELMFGCGFALYNNLISLEDINKCNYAINNILKHETNELNTDSTQILSDDIGHNSIYNENNDQGIRIWNLLNKGQIFEKLVQIPLIMEIFDQILGNDFILGSFAANCLVPGSKAQLPHLDYPYWDFNNKNAWPFNVQFNNNSFFSMNCQTCIMVDDFTQINGCTKVLPYSQDLRNNRLKWPNEEYFSRNSIDIIGKKGSILIFTGLLNHGSSTNNSNYNRTSILGQYLSKYVRPMEDIQNQVCQTVKNRSSQRMKQLLGFYQIYPKMFEQPTEEPISYDEM